MYIDIDEVKVGSKWQGKQIGLDSTVLKKKAHPKLYICH